MDPKPLVTEFITDGKKFLDRLTAEGVPYTQAFWGWDGDRDMWYLYVVTPLANRDRTSSPYTPVVDVLRSLRGELDILSDEIVVLGADSPTALEMSRLRQSFPKRFPQNFFPRLVGNTPLGDVYLYPTPAPVTAAG